MTPIMMAAAAWCFHSIYFLLRGKTNNNSRGLRGLLGGFPFYLFPTKRKGFHQLNSSRYHCSVSILFISY